MASQKNDLLLTAVEKIAINPEDAHQVANNYKLQVTKAYPSLPTAEVNKMVASKIIDRYSKLTGASGGLTSLVGVIPGVGTAVAMLGGGMADAVASMKLQVDMTMCIAAAYDYDLNTEDAKHLSFLIAGLGAVEQTATSTGTQFASKAGVKIVEQYLKGATLQTIKQIFKVIGVNFTKAALKKAIPFGIGVAISTTTNYALTQYVGKKALEWFVYDHDMKSNQAV